MMISDKRDMKVEVPVCMPNLLNNTFDASLDFLDMRVHGGGGIDNDGKVNTLRSAPQTEQMTLLISFSLIDFLSSMVLHLVVEWRVFNSSSNS
jgi:hypothetical protein